jgi:ERCC4-type nuclease
MEQLQDRKILMCVHEPQHIEDAIKKLGLVVERTSMESGDYMIGNVLIERKDIDDYCGSLASGRLFEQLYRQATTGKRNILIVIGTFPRSLFLRCNALKREGKAEQATIEYKQFFDRLHKMERTVFVAYGILMVHLKTEEEFMEWIQYLWMRGSKETFAPVVAKKEDPFDVKVDILSRIPSVGAKLATELAKLYTIRQLMDMSDGELEVIKINGRKIGVKAKKIKEYLNL